MGKDAEKYSGEKTEMEGHVVYVVQRGIQMLGLGEQIDWQNEQAGEGNKN